jgi:hypothetical protein
MGGTLTMGGIFTESITRIIRIGALIGSATGTTKEVIVPIDIVSMCL